jgi:hypothetical protein
LRSGLVGMTRILGAFGLGLVGMTRFLAGVEKIPTSGKGGQK